MAPTVSNVGGIILPSVAGNEDNHDHMPLLARRRFLVSKRPSSCIGASHRRPGDPAANRPYGSIVEERPGLPRGLKFDPSDEDLVWHLLAKVGKEGFLPHPFIDELIISLDESDAIFHAYPMSLPGIKQDGSMSYFFHTKFETYDTGRKKRQKRNNVGSGNFIWRNIGETEPVLVDGIYKGHKQVMILCMSTADGEKLEKANWMMHQYCLGAGEEEDGELVVSKVFYQQRSKQGGMPLETMGYLQTEAVACHETRVEVSTVKPPVQHPECSPTTKALRDLKVEPPESDQPLGSIPTYCNIPKMQSFSGDDNVKRKRSRKSGNEQDIVKGLNRVSAECQKDFLSRLSTENNNRGGMDLNLFMVDQSSRIAMIGHNYDMSKGISSQPNEVTDDISQNQTLVSEVSFHPLGDKHAQGDILGSSEKSCVIPESLPEATRNPDDLTCRLHENENCEAGISESMASHLGQGLARKDGDNQQLDPFRSNFPIEVKSEPLEEWPIDNVDEANEDNQLLEPGPLDCCPVFKNELLEDGTINDVREANGRKLQSFSLSQYPTESLDIAVQSTLKDNHRQDNATLDALDSGDNAVANCRCSHQTSLLEEVQLTSTAAKHWSSSMSNTFAMENACVISHDSTKAGNCLGDIPFSCRNMQEEMGNTLLSQVSSNFPVKVKFEPLESGLLSPCVNSQSITSGFLVSGDEVKGEFHIKDSNDTIDNMTLSQRMNILRLVSAMDHGNSLKSSQQAVSKTSKSSSSCSVDSEAKHTPLRRKRKKTATNSVEAALEEDAPGLLRVLMDKGISMEEIKLYGIAEDDIPMEISSIEDSFEELENVITKLFCERTSLLKFPLLKHMKGSKAVYCLPCLISLIEQARYLQFRNSPVEWGWCRDLQSFIFVFEKHNRIVLERPEYGYATYFFELLELLPVNWQIKRLVTAMKLSSCSRTTLIENRPLLVGEDLTEGEARVLEEYGWRPNSGLGSMLNYRDRVLHDRRDVRYSSEWRAKIQKLLVAGHDGGRTVLDFLPKKVVKYMGDHSLQVNLGQRTAVSDIDNQMLGIKIEQ